MICSIRERPASKKFSQVCGCAAALRTLLVARRESPIVLPADDALDRECRQREVESRSGTDILFSRGTPTPRTTADIFIAFDITRAHTMCYAAIPTTAAEQTNGSSRWSVRLPHE
jgi:hypothetical protein